VRDIDNCYVQKKLVLVIRKHRWCQVREKPEVHFGDVKYMRVMLKRLSRLILMMLGGGLPALSLASILAELKKNVCCVNHKTQSEDYGQAICQV
jgi:hypothetical protein